MAINKTKEGIYYYSIRYKDKNGNVIQKKSQNSKWKTKREVREAINVFLDSINKKESSKMSYNDLHCLFINEKSNVCKQRTITTYEEAHKYHISKFFGEMLISEITTEDIIRWQNNLLKTKYKNSYLKTLQDIFKRVLLWGIKNDYLKQNPYKCERAKRHEIKKEMDIFTPDDYSKFKSVIEDNMWAIVFDVLYWTGIRKGELMALRFRDINLNDSEITVSKTYDTRNRITTPPKTSNSYRTVVIPTSLKENLSNYIEEQKNIIGYNDDLFLFGFHKPLPPSTLDNRKIKYCKMAGVDLIRIHDFRHSHVSLLINDGIDDFVISKRLGHSRDMVNNTYGHMFKNRGKEVINTLDKRIAQMNNVSN